MDAWGLFVLFLSALTSIQLVRAQTAQTAASAAVLSIRGDVPTPLTLTLAEFKLSVLDVVRLKK